MHIFKRTMMSKNPNFFSLNKKEQDIYKIENNELLEFPFKQILYRDFLNIELKNEDEEYDKEIPEDVNLKMNEQSTYLRGIGENYFYLNEFFADDESILTFKTLYDYDLKEHNFQEKCLVEDEHFKEKTTVEPYRMRLNFRWARSILKEKNSNGEYENKFYYLTLASLAIYIHEEIEKITSEYLNNLIPHEYVSGKNNGKREGNGSIFDFKVDAKGLEGQLDELRSRKYKYIANLYNELQIYLDENTENKIWCIDNSSKHDPSKTYIFSNKEVLQEIRFSNWQEDTNKFITEDSSIIDKIIKEQTEKSIIFLDDEFKDIMKNYDPKVVKLKKKMKVVIADEALDDLVNIIKKDDDDE